MVVTQSPHQIWKEVEQNFWLGHIKLNEDAILALQQQGIDSMTDMGDIRDDG